MTDFGELVKMCRDNRHMTIEQVSRISGVAVSTIGRLESNANCTVDTLEKLLNAMGYELEILPMK